MGKILCGPSNLRHIGWEKSLLPAAGRKPHFVELLAQQFDAVEIGTSFTEFLKPELTRLWARKAEQYPNFRFTAKLHRQFTHARELRPSALKAFSDGLRPLAEAGKLGCVLMQFPWSFRYTSENRAHFIALRRAFHEFPLAAEARHSSWMLDEAIGTFIDYRVAFCNIDQPAYTNAMPPTAFLTSSVGYVRLHGRNCFNWFGSAERPSRAPRYDYVYSEEELMGWVNRIDQLRNYAESTFVIANNGTEGQSIANALQLSALLDGRLPALPKEVTAGCRRAAVSQSALFTEFSGRAVA